MAKLTALTIDCPNDESAEDAVLRNPTWTANVREKGVIVATFYGEKVRV